MVVTEEKKKDIYPMVLFEDGTVSSESIYYEGVNPHRTTRSGSVSGMEQLLRKSTGSIGAGKLLKVMGGDKVEARVDYFIPNDPTDNSGASGVQAILDNLVGLLSGSSAPALLKGEGTAITANLDSSGTPFSNFLSQQTNSLSMFYLSNRNQHCRFVAVRK